MNLRCVWTSFPAPNWLGIRALLDDDQNFNCVGTAPGYPDGRLYTWTWSGGLTDHNEHWEFLDAYSEGASV